MHVVIDTNVIISAALSPMGSPARAVNYILDADDVQIVCTTSILNEYRKVLAYKKLKIDADTQAAILQEIIKIGKLINPPLSTTPMPDETDRIFYDAARASNAMLITGNAKHYPVEPFIVTPTQFLAKIAHGA
ncbi:MAG: putative toxin-antitoxin system toxin component, PIN family [Defluviitaleaceae bacterium]|nr:putative toxin-antitoxin system toxin component, PIN family [Defluviitaleaceae bacterium]MCL2275895.1 putative toxin-antitoxin system toxin component, PIN family [Defluviitaleaceae bacterium]